MTIKLLKRGVVQALYEDIPRNIDRYMNGDFSDLPIGEHVREVKKTTFDPTDIVSLNPARGGVHDAENAFIIYNSMNGMSPYLARDERVWVYLTHFEGLQFTRDRWLQADAKEEETIRSIRTHFFARIGGARAFERNNAFACLWWWAYVADRYDGATLEKTLEALLHHTDLRSSVIERPTTSRSAKVFSAIMDAVIKRMFDEPNHDFFVRRGNRAIYREWLKEINRNGGIRLFDARSYEDLSKLFEHLANAAEQSAADQQPS